MTPCSSPRTTPAASKTPSTAKASSAKAAPESAPGTPSSPSFARWLPLRSPFVGSPRPLQSLLLLRPGCSTVPLVPVTAAPTLVWAASPELLWLRLLWLEEVARITAILLLLLLKLLPELWLLLVARVTHVAPLART